MRSTLHVFVYRLYPRDSFKLYRIWFLILTEECLVSKDNKRKITFCVPCNAIKSLRANLNDLAREKMTSRNSNLKQNESDRR